MGLKKLLLAICLAEAVVVMRAGCEQALTNSLKDVFGNRFLVGVAVNGRQFTGSDERAVRLVESHFNSISPENVLKWESVQPLPGQFAFEVADRFVEFGLQRGMVVIGHTLVWHHQTPGWVFTDGAGNRVTREVLISRMREHIMTVVGRYKGKIKGWDVVNEALEEDGSLRRSPWLEIIGPDYIRLAFEFAREADPGAELYYNDFSMENAPKRRGALRLLRELKAQGVRIDGVGLQGHYLMKWPSPGQLDRTIKQFAGLGLKVMITELDVDVLPRVEGYVGADVRTIAVRDPRLLEKLDPYRAGLPEAVDRALAKRYAELFEVFARNQGSITRVTFWGLTDGDSWLNVIPVRGRHNYPLLFDRDYRPKRAFYEVVQVGLKSGNALGGRPVDSRR